MPDTVICSKVGLNSIGFTIPSEVMKVRSITEGDLVRIQILQIVKNKTKEVIPLQNIFMVKTITAGSAIILKSNLRKAFNIESGDILTIEFIEVQKQTTSK